MTEQDSPKAQQLLRDANDLLRSAYAIAARKGEDTNWDAFKKRLEPSLIVQSRYINGTDFKDAAVCTPRTFRLPQFIDTPTETKVEEPTVVSFLVAFKNKKLAAAKERVHQAASKLGW